MILSLIVGFLLGVAAIVFALQNTMAVSLSFMSWQFESSLAVLVLLSLVTGAFIALLIVLPSAIRDSFVIGGLRKQNRKLIQELEDEKSRPQTVVVEERPPEVVDLREE